MKKQLPFLLLALFYTAALKAQPGTTRKKPVEYEIFMRLQPGQKAISFYSCLWLNEKNEFRQLVIENEGHKYSVVNGQEQKHNLTMEQMLQYTTNSRCDEYGPDKLPKATRYSGSRLTTRTANGKYSIKSRNDSYGPFEEILFIQESGEKFVAVARAQNSGKTEIIYIDWRGTRKLLPALPVRYVTNADCTKAAVIMPPAEATAMELVNTWQLEKRQQYLDSLSGKKLVAWFNNDSTATIDRKFVRLEYDVSGRHFLSVYANHFFIDGKKINKNISAAGTRIFAAQDAANWAYWYEIYLGISDGTHFQNIISPHMTSENGKDYLNWFIIESNKNGDIIKRGKKEL